MADAAKFAHLHLHTHYNLLDGFNRIPQLVEQTKKLGMNALAITDHGTYARADIDITDAADGSLVARIEDYEFVIDPTLNQAFRRNHLAPRVGV